MRFLQVIPHYVPAYRFGGPLQVAHALGRAFVRAGHTVVVCTTNRRDEAHDLAVSLDRPVDQDGVTVYYEPTVLLRYWGFSPSLWRRVRAETAHADLVLVHAHYQFANWAGALLARRSRKPYLVFAHGSLSTHGITGKTRWLKRLYLRLMEHGNLRNARFIVFNAPEEKAYSLYGSFGRVVSSGIDPVLLANPPAPGAFRTQHPELRDKTIFLFLGRLDVVQKGLDILLTAFARLCREHPQARLVLVGPDENGGARRLRMMAQEHGIGDIVVMTGLLTGQQKLAALRDADAFVLPSRFEGLSIALLEALYFGLPVLVTDQVGLCTEVKSIHAGTVVPANADGVLRGLKVLIDPSQRLSMRGKGTDLILRKYTWDAIAAGLLVEMRSAICQCGGGDPRRAEG